MVVVNIVIAGKTACEEFGEACLVADYLSQNLPNFCYDLIEKPVLDWQAWLCKVNVKNRWHHVGSPIIWKELVMSGSKPYYIGGLSEFLEYCHSYYNLDVYMGIEKYQDLTRNYSQFRNKILLDELEKKRLSISETIEPLTKNNFVVCISGAACPLVKGMISRLLDMTSGKRSISKIYLYDEECSVEFLQRIETECMYVETSYAYKVVTYADKIGTALTRADVLLVYDHVPFQPEMSIGEWLNANMNLMQNLAIKINASASRSIYIILANVGPACFNATVLIHSVTTNVKNIVVATSDLGLQVLDTLSEVTECPMRRIFCPPVWGFVGINHLVDVKTTIHQYNSFDPYPRHAKIRESTLHIGVVKPNMRTMEYLTHFDDTIWVKVAEKKEIVGGANAVINNVNIAIANLIRVWLIEADPPDYVVNLGLLCDGTFGLNFDGAFSQPARLVGREWRPAKEFFYPKDNFVKLPYLEYIANLVMRFEGSELPPIIPYTPCSCKPKLQKRKGVW